VARIPRKIGDRVRTDRRDALALACYLRAGELAPIAIPDARARQQRKATLLRQGLRYDGKSSWMAAHERYLDKVSFAHPAPEFDYPGNPRRFHVSTVPTADLRSADRGRPATDR
jgi:transposase